MLDFQNVHVLVVGDALLDHYVRGDVDRISPEAPVPVLVWRDERHVAGGAANVAVNIGALGGSATLVSVVGPDASAQTLEERVRSNSERCDVRFVVDAHRPTPQKTRFVCSDHQFLRLDREKTAPISTEAETALIEQVVELLGRSDVVVLSDYAKGVLSDRVLKEVIACARAAARPVLVDPKRKSFSAYEGATVIAPNRKELSDATGGAPCREVADAIRAVRIAAAASNANILLTRSEDGMSYYPIEGEPVHLPTDAKQVIDVTGAGDTVIAALALGLGAKFPIPQAMRVANAAAGVAVTRAGTAIVTQEDLIRKLAESQFKEEESPDFNYAVPLTQAVAQRERWREAGYVVGFTNGCFDILHPGHLSLLRQAKQNCDRLIVAVNSDDSVRRLKGPTRPTQHQEARAEMVAGLEPTDLVLIFDEDTPKEVITALEPDVLVKGADYAIDQVVGADVVLGRGGRVVLANLTPGQSTSRLIERAKG